MKISIGILAHNEARVIETTIRALFAQSLVHEAPADWRVQVLVLPNGCTDQTAAAARAALERAAAGLEKDVSARVEWRICEVAEAGKSNAWNRLVHEFAWRDADAIFFMDADIGFLSARCMRMILDKLMATPHALAAVGRAVKDVAIRRGAGISGVAGRVSALVSRSSSDAPAAIAGGLYVLRGTAARAIWMPRGLLVEDGYVRGMLISDFYTNPGLDLSRVVREDGAGMVFEAVLSPWAKFRHSRRLLAGSLVNTCVYDELWARPGDIPAGEFIRRRNEQDPKWLEALVRTEYARKHRLTAKGDLLIKRLKALAHKPLPKALLYLPVVLASMPYDLAVLWAAHRAVRRGDLRW